MSKFRNKLINLMLSKKLGLRHLVRYVKGKRILLRADLNVPMANGKVAHDARIAAIVPSVEFLLKNGAHSIVMMSHLGRPHGNRISELSLGPVASVLEDHL